MSTPYDESRFSALPMVTFRLDAICRRLTEGVDDPVVAGALRREAAAIALDHPAIGAHVLGQYPALELVTS